MVLIQTDPLQLWEVLEGVVLHSFNFVSIKIQILNGAKIVVSEKTVFYDREGFTVFNYYAVQLWEIIQNLLRQEIDPRWAREINNSCF